MVPGWPLTQPLVQHSLSEEFGVLLLASEVVPGSTGSMVSQTDTAPTLKGLPSSRGGRVETKSDADINYKL